MGSTAFNVKVGTWRLPPNFNSSIYCAAVIWSKSVWGAIRAMQLLGEVDWGWIARSGPMSKSRIIPSLLESSHQQATIYFRSTCHVMGIYELEDTPGHEDMMIWRKPKVGFKRKISSFIENSTPQSCQLWFAFHLLISYAWPPSAPFSSAARYCENLSGKVFPKGSIRL